MGIREHRKGALGVLQSKRVVSSSCFINHELLFCFVFFSNRHKVLRVIPKTKAQVDFLRSLHPFFNNEVVSRSSVPAQLSRKYIMNESLKRGKTQASKSRLQLGLNLIGYRDDKSFLDKSQCELKQNLSRGCQWGRPLAVKWKKN